MGENNFWADRRTRIGTETAGELAKKYNRQNYRLHPEAQQAAVEGSLDELGFIDAVSVSEKVDKLFDGHLRVELALLRFGEDFKLPVDYYDLNEAETAKALLYRDMTAQMAEINIPALQELRFEMPEFDNPSFDEFLTTEFDFDFGGGNGTEGDTPPAIDKAAELQEKWQVQPGQLWGLGEHRLICGDCTDAAVVERVMEGEKASITFTSPPYNTGVSAQLSGNTSIGDNLYRDAYDDNQPQEEYLELLKDFTINVLNVCDYVFVNLQVLAGNKMAFIRYLNQFQNNFADVAIWDKGRAAPQQAQRVMDSRFEFILIFSNDATRAIGTREFRGMVHNVFCGGPQSNNEFATSHAATFPVYFPEHFIKIFTNDNELILEPFLGTGTTLIACHNLHRRCRGIEIHPPYVSVTLQRFLDHTGIQPQLIE